MTSSTLPPIVAATVDDTALVAYLVAEAFSTLDAARWLVNDPEARVIAMAGQFEILVEHALRHGHADLLADGSAAAVWVHRRQPVPPPCDYDRRLAEACGEHTGRFQILDALLDEHHPVRPHHHLAFLAVCSEQRGTGRGTALIRAHHAKLDIDGVPAYLEAANHRCRDLYAREGYLALKPFALPDGPSFYPMWRAPNTRRTNAPGRAPANRRSPGAADRRHPALA
jgi:GNAT superfamily N-acetyltransferase